MYPRFFPKLDRFYSFYPSNVFRFFRSIRQSLLAENKTFKYLKYAVGEVLLVVIGILIALSVNNWNEDQKLEKQRLELIENLKVDFQEDLIKLDDLVPKTEESVGRLDRFLEVAMVDNRELSIREIMSLLRGQFHDVNYRPTLPSYDSAKSSGSIALINDLALARLFNIHDQEVQHLSDQSFFKAQTVWTGSWWEMRKKLGSEYALLSNRLVPEPLRLSDQEFREMIAQKEIYAAWENFRRLRGTILSRYKTMIGTNKQILAALEAL